MREGEHAHNPSTEVELRPKEVPKEELATVTADLATKQKAERIRDLREQIVSLEEAAKKGGKIGEEAEQKIQKLEDNLRTIEKESITHTKEVAPEGRAEKRAPTREELRAQIKELAKAARGTGTKAEEAENQLDRKSTRLNS